MTNPTVKIAVQAMAIAVVSVAAGVAFNFIRPNGIPLIAEVPYEIFSPCKDSEVVAETAGLKDISSSTNKTILYVDARQHEAFKAEHVEGAINAPYSPLFGATEADIAKIAEEVSKRGATSVMVYGTQEDPTVPGSKIDFGKPLAQQLVENKVAGVKHLEGGLDVLKQTGVKTVKSPEGI